MKNKKANFGCVGGIFALVVGFILLIYKYCLYIPIKWIIKQINAKYDGPIKNNYTTDNSKIQLPIKSIDFNVAGITYENRQDEISKMINSALKYNYISKYDGMTNKEIKEYGDTVFEANNVHFDDIKLINTKYENKDAIEVHVQDICDNNKYIMVGYVPKKSIKELSDFLKFKDEHPEYKYKQFICLTGGKGKTIDEFGEIQDIDLNYGINVTFHLYEK